MPRKTPTPLSPAQLEIMNVVWDRGEASVAQIWQALSRRRSVARNTVQTMVTRLAGKGWLRHRQEGNAFVYAAARPRARALGGLVARLVESAFGGSASSMVLSLLEERPISPEEARRIRQIIDAAAAKGGAKGGAEGRKEDRR